MTRRPTRRGEIQPARVIEGLRATNARRYRPRSYARAWWLRKSPRGTR